MMNFATWFENKHYNEAFDRESISKHMPLDGKWRPSLDTQGEDSYQYSFNVPGDNVGTKDYPGYKVTFATRTRYPNYIVENVTIAFKREGTGYNDANVGVHGDVMNSVLKAVGEFIDVKKPEKITWTAAGKTRVNPKQNQIVNPEARKSIYERWAIRNIFPDYIGINSENWIRKDIYQKEYVEKKGAPPVPDVASDAHPSVKRKAHDELVKAIKEKQEEMERTARETAERERVERLQALLNDPEQNPNRVQEGDVVEISDEAGLGARNKVGKIFKLYDNYGQLTASIRVASPEDEMNSNNEDNFTHHELRHALAKYLTKETEERKAERYEAKRVAKEKLAQAITQPEQNPNGVNIGDVVDLSDTPSHHYHIGKIKSFFLDDSNILCAKVNLISDYETHNQHFTDYTEDVIVRDIRKETEDVKTSRQQKIINRAVSDHYKNPYGIKLNDIVDLYSSGFSKYKIGKVVDFILRGNLYAKVKFPSNSELENPDFENLQINFDKSTHSDDVLARTLRKEDEHTKNARIQREEERREEAERERVKLINAFSSEQQNPNGLKVGDDVVYYDRNNNLNPRNGLSGKVEKGEVSYYGSSLKLFIKWDDESNQKINSSQLSGDYELSMNGDNTGTAYARVWYKNTPELKHEIETKRQVAQEAENQRVANERLAAQRARHERRVNTAANLQQETPEDIVNDTVKNPQGLKIGDHVIVSGGYGRYRGRQGVIISMTRTSWGPISTGVKIVNTVKNFNADQLTKDTSEEAQERQRRQQARAARTQQTQSALQSNPQNLQIGDTIRVLSGRNRGKIGRILRFTNVNNTIRLTIVDDQQVQFTSQLDNVVRNQAA